MRRAAHDRRAAARMIDPASLPLADWDSFYVIVGSSSAALTGLMFVVVTLLPDSRVDSAGEGLGAFATPTVVHFGAALLVSSILCAPWHVLEHAAVVVGLVGVSGLTYEIVVVRRARRQTAYAPVFEDWLWHGILPFVAYAGFVFSWIGLVSSQTVPLFGVAAATMLLLFIGIHNAWDTVTYMALDRIQSRSPGDTSTPKPPLDPSNQDTI
jgi:hypothetical protein